MSELPDKSPHPAEKSVSGVTWGPIAALVVAVGAYFIGRFLGSIFIFAALVVSGWSIERTADWFSESTVAQFLLLLGVETVTLAVLYIFMLSRKATWRMIGLIRPRLRDVGYALAGFAAYLPLYVLLVSALTRVIPSLDVDQQQQIGFQHADTPPELLLVMISLVILPPLIEEILCRGFLYSGLKSKLPVIWAVLITSILFGAAHLQAFSGEPLLWIAAIDTFVLSLVLIYLREISGSLWPAIGLHMIKNGLEFTLLFVYHMA